MMHEHGLGADLLEIEQRLSTRRRLLGWLVSAGATPLLGCDGLAPGTVTGLDADASGGALHDATAIDSGGEGDGSLASCSTTPLETGGPFPADSTIGPNVLLRSGILRGDIRSSFAIGSATAAGLRLSITLKVVDLACRPRQGAVVYLWHCDREGRYSLYSTGVTEQDYLRGIQVADRDGNARFTTIFPGCYPGRWPHMHFEVFSDLATATTAGSRPLLTSQLAFREDDCQAAYAASDYAQSLQYLQQLSPETDGVFRDGFDRQLANVSGSVTSGFTGTFTIAI